MTGQKNTSRDNVYADAFRHHLWANQTLLAACAGLPDDVLDAGLPGTYGSVRDTLVHTFASEERYLLRITDEPSPSLALAEGHFPGLVTLKDRAREGGETLITLAQQTRDNRVIRGEYRGEKFAIPLSIFLAQAINHATEHRAQIAAILTQNGVVPPNMDVWTYFRSMSQQG